MYPSVLTDVHHLYAYCVSLCNYIYDPHVCSLCHSTIYCHTTSLRSVRQQCSGLPLCLLQLPYQRFKPRTAYLQGCASFFRLTALVPSMLMESQFYTPPRVPDFQGCSPCRDARQGCVDIIWHGQRAQPPRHAASHSPSARTTCL
jgi:hypothetical protein